MPPVQSAQSISRRQCLFSRPRGFSGWAGYLALLFASCCGSAWATGLKVVSAIGPVTVLQAGQSVSAKQGMELDGAFSLRAGDSAYIQLRSEEGTLIALPESGEIRFPDTQTRALHLQRGGVNILVNGPDWKVETPTHQIRVSGYLRLRDCAESCTEEKGLYGKSVSGQAVVEYKGGRRVLRGRSFLAPADGGRPRVLPRDIPLLAENPRLENAAKVKAELATQIKGGLEDFRAGNYSRAREVLADAQEDAPSEPVLAYYLGLIALEQQENTEALRQLERFTREDPEAAQTRGVGQIITLLTANQLREEVAHAIKQEQAISSEPPEPNTIAIQPFSNRSDPTYAPLAKGIAAMIITDLSKVPGLKVLERQKVQKLLDEIRLSGAGLVESETMVKAGRLLRAEKVFVGSIGVQ